MPRLAFDDFTAGAVATYGEAPVGRDDIVAFARAFDPQPFHLDEAAAKDSFVGELIASGWHTCALVMRMLADGVLLGSTSMGSPGVEAVKWLRPVRPGDTLRVRQTVLETKPSRSRPEMGLVRLRLEALNQAGEPVMEQTNWIMFGRRDAEVAPAKPAVPDRSAAGPLVPPVAAAPSPYFEDLVPGAVTQLGAHMFTAEAIVAFARRFDPQPFHVDAEAARCSSFGGLCASGWHTAAVWMRMMAQRREMEAAALAAGERPARLGPSPGFTDLRWLKPVYAGDTIAYASTVVETRPSASRPGWGLVFHQNTGVNQHGAEVFAFRGCVFWERRP